MAWYSTTREADIRACLIEEGMWGCRTVQAPMPDKDGMLDAMQSVTLHEHMWIGRNVGSMGYYAVQMRWDNAYKINRIAQMLESPTQCTLKAVRRVVAYLAGTWDKTWWCPRVNGNTWDLYVDPDHAGEKKLYSQSWTGAAFFLNGFLTHWKSKMQPRASLNSAAAEPYAMSEACNDARLRYQISEDMGYVEQWHTVSKVDNAAPISFQQATKMNTK